MLQFLNRRRARAHKAAQQTKDELFDELLRGNFSSYDDLLETIRSYPEEVISSCQDAMGNSILHIILCGNFIIVDTSDNADNNYGISSTFLVRRNLLVGADDYAAEEHQTNRNAKSCSVLQLIHFLVHCSNTTDKRSNSKETGDINAISENFVSVLRHRSAGGSLPLHIACRFCSSQQLDVVQYILEAYPYALQCPDVWGHLPLHEACSNFSVPLEVVLLLLQQYPVAASAPNHDGNLPLHLAVAVRSTSTAPYTQFLSSDEHQLEIVQCLLCYWPDAIHHTNLKGQTALQMANDASNNVLMIEFLQLLSEQPVSPSLPQENTNSVNVFQGDKRSLKAPINPFDDEFYEDQTKTVPEPEANAVEDFQSRESMQDYDTLLSDGVLIQNESRNSIKPPNGIEPEDESERLCVELVEDFQVVITNNWSEYNPFSQNEFKETEY